jgi:hypothetical protein
MITAIPSRFVAALLFFSSAASAQMDDIRVYFPNGRVSLYWACDVVAVDADTLAANCGLRLENEPGINPHPPSGSEPSLHMEIFGITPGVSPWYRVDHVDGTGACVLTATYAVPFPGTGYIVQCDGTDLLYGDSFDGSPL